MNVIDLCAGYGGLSMGLGLEPTWYSEIDPHACAVYEHNHPGIKNLGDVRDCDHWPDADIVTAGFPCQPASAAGRRKGINDDRWLWPAIAKCLGVVQPDIVVLENVRGLLTVNRQAAIQEVLRDLAALGFDATWGVVRASDTGACHRRERWFCIAVAADADCVRIDRTTSQQQGRWEESQGDHRLPLLPTPTARDVKDAAFSPAAFGDRLPGFIRDLILLPTPTATYPGGSAERYRERLVEHDGRGGEFLPLNHVAELLPTPTVQQGRNATSGRQEGSTHHTGWTLNDIAYADTWKQYAPAIARHELMLGRPAPDPTFPNPRSKSGKSLSPLFVEWMMGLPEGWVTDVPGIPRTAQLKLLGNGVVPQQAALAAHLIESLW